MELLINDLLALKRAGERGLSGGTPVRLFRAPRLVGGSKVSALPYLSHARRLQCIKALCWFDKKEANATESEGDALFWRAMAKTAQNYNGLHMIRRPHKYIIDQSNKFNKEKNNTTLTNLPRAYAFVIRKKA
jgi:hypothetical protein